MTTTLLRPNADSKADWTENPAGTAFSKLDEVVTQPTAPSDVSGDNINVAAAATCRVDCETFTLPGTDTVTQVKGWGYMATGTTRPCHIAVIGPSPLGTMADTTVPQATASAWQSATFTGTITQSDINALQLQWLSSAGTGTCTVYAGYIEVTSSTVTVLSAGTSTSTGALGLGLPLAATSAGASTTAGTLRLTVGLAATSAGTATSTGTLTAALALAATSAGTSVSTGVLTATLALQGTSAGTSASTGDLTAQLALEALSGGTGIDSGDLSVLVPSNPIVELGDRRTATLGKAGPTSAVFGSAITAASFEQAAARSALIVGSTPEPDTIFAQAATTVTFTDSGRRLATITSER